MSDNVNLIGAVSVDSILTVLDLSGKVMFTYKTQYNELNTKQIFKFTKDDNIIAIGNESDAVLLGKDGKIIQTFKKHTDGVNAIDLSPDNNFIATGSSDSTINIWYYNFVRSRYDFYNTITWHEDTVLSVSFGSNNLFLVSTSKGKFVIVGDINNRVEMNYRHFRDYFYAEFSPTGNGIIIGSYYYENQKLIKVYYSLNYTHPVMNLTRRANDGDIYSENFGFPLLKFSKDEDYFISTDNEKIYLTDNNLALEKNRFNIGSTYTLLEYSGTNPFFTPDANYLYYVDRNIIHTCSIKIEKILEVASNVKE
jgi:WD40 repeat protein